MKIFRKILGLSLLGLILMPMFLFTAGELEAVGDTKILLGNHEQGQLTNMMVQFALTDNLVAGESVLLDFDDTVDLSNLDTDCIDDMLMEEDFDPDNDDVDESARTFGLGVNQFTCAVNKASSSITMTLNGGSTFLTSGTYLRLFIGPRDGLDLYNGGTPGAGTDIVSGADPTNNDDFKGPDSTVDAIVLPVAGSSFNLDITETGGVTRTLVSALLSDQDMPVSGTIKPYIQMRLYGDTETDVLAEGEEWAFDYAYIRVTTNAEEGYEMYYRSTDLVKADNPLEIITPANNQNYAIAGQGIWGLYFYVSTSTSSGVQPSIEPGYTAGKISAFTDGLLHRVLYTPSGPSDYYSIIYTMVSSSLEDAAGDYQATVVFNVFGRF